MHKGRLEAFSDAVIAILLTIMVLELKTPEGASAHALWGLWPKFLSYMLSFVYIGIYWNNHHHLLQATHRINGTILWANLHLLFWLSIVPFFTDWMGERRFASVPVFSYGCVLLLAAVAYYLLQLAIVAEEGADSDVAVALGRDLKGKLSPVFYLVALPMAFVARGVSLALYLAVALMWFIPDRRFESRVKQP
ncbi:MAG: hypothetical protein JWL70_1605 [Acidimicrobiia bacterium]|nr:hypothetical protein [Acidimicrobiia bacterium]